MLCATQMYYLIRPVKPLETLESLQIKACGVGVAGGLLLGTIPQHVFDVLGYCRFGPVLRFSLFEISLTGYKQKST
ncbi:hypothetical protein THPR109532_07085 [Thalassospira profundimaris]